MISWPCGAFWPFLLTPQTCAGETNARHPSIHVSNPQYQQTSRNCQAKLVAAIETQIVRKNSKKWPIFTEKNALKNNFLWVFGHVWTRFFMFLDFLSTLGTYWIFWWQKKLIDFSPLSTLFSLSGQLPKAITAPWKWFLRVQWWNTFQLGPKKPPKPLLAKKNSTPPNPKLHSQPSVRCKIHCLGLGRTSQRQMVLGKVTTERPPADSSVCSRRGSSDWCRLLHTDIDSWIDWPKSPLVLCIFHVLHNCLGLGIPCSLCQPDDSKCVLPLHTAT